MSAVQAARHPFKTHSPRRSRARRGEGTRTRRQVTAGAGEGYFIRGGRTWVGGHVAALLPAGPSQHPPSPAPPPQGGTVPTTTRPPARSRAPSPARLRRIFICRAELPALTNHVRFPARVQCLLDLANLYAATTSQTHAVTASPAAAGTLPDRLALGYVYDPSSKPSSSCSSSCPEVRIQYPSLPAADLFV